MKNIILIGSGNVATNLGVTLKKRGYNIIQVWSNKFENAKILANKIDSNPVDNLAKLKQADLYIISTKDESFDKLINQLNNKSVVHTSGSIEIKAFKNKFKNYGVLYPLQTFNKNKIINFSDIPICIEANNKKFHKNLKNICKKISNRVVEINSEQRKALHIAAVFACNFSNHMLTISESLLKNSGLNFTILNPLIRETFEKILTESPKNIQTGPAKRKDITIIKNHISNISDTKLKKIYKLVSQSIIEYDT